MNNRFSFGISGLSKGLTRGWVYYSDRYGDFNRTDVNSREFINIIKRLNWHGPSRESEYVDYWRVVIRPKPQDYNLELELTKPSSDQEYHVEIKIPTGKSERFLIFYKNEIVLRIKMKIRIIDGLSLLIDYFSSMTFDKFFMELQKCEERNYISILSVTPPLKTLNISK